MQRAREALCNFVSAARAASGELDDLRFACFALGNKQYEHFCYMGRWAQSSLKGLGATPVCELGEGDDDEDLDADFEKWRETLWEVRRRRDGPRSSTEPTPSPHKSFCVSPRTSAASHARTDALCRRSQIPVGAHEAAPGGKDQRGRLPPSLRSPTRIRCAVPRQHRQPSRRHSPRPRRSVPSTMP